MPNYIRIINRALWPKTEDLVEGFDVNKIEAKTITKEFRNNDDTLSLWAVENEDDAVLAMVTGAKKIEGMWTLRISNEIIENSKLEVKNEASHPNVKEIGRFHYNIKNLTYKSLADVSNVIIDALKDDKNLREYTKSDIREILNAAVRKGKVDYSLLDEKLKNEINKLRESALK